MSYIGNPPISGNFQVCDAISVVNGQAAYTMQVSSANVSPESANHMLVSLNGVLQKPGSSFTISGSTITFASNLATGDVIDFILLLGNVNDIGTPSDATVTDAKTNFVSTSSGAGLQIKGDGTTDGTLQLNCSQNSHGVKLRSPSHSSGQSYTLTLPTGNVTADKFLKVASVSGSGTTGVGQLSFDDAGGGAYELLSTTTLSSTTHVDFTSLSSTYQDFKFIGSGIVNSADTQTLACRFFDKNGLLLSNNTEAGVSSNSPHYDFTQFGHNDDSFTNDAQNQTFIDLGQDLGNDVNNYEVYNFEVDLLNPHLTGRRTIVHSKVVYVPGDSYAGAVQFSQGFNTSSEGGDHSRSGIRLFPASGNFASGKISFYGRKA